MSGAYEIVATAVFSTVVEADSFEEAQMYADGFVEEGFDIRAGDWDIEIIAIDIDGRPRSDV